MQRKWWKEAVVYQVYPRSFYDSDGDGIGDIRGITARLDYLKELGIDVIWLCPVYKSPNDDNGYDISDYRDILPEFGTMKDWEELLHQVHRRGMKLIMDLVVNHTSDEHSWFVESRSSRNNPKRDYYIWREGKDGREPNNWSSFFTPSAWEYDRATGEYYLHLFSRKQPDLNWENPEVRNEIYDMMQWWLEKGIDGFRMDVINCISKHENLPSVEGTGDGYQWGGQYFFNGPRVHEYIREMNERVLSKYDIMTVGETPDVTPEEGLLFTGEDRGELNMLFNFELMDIDAGPGGKWDIVPWKLTDFKAIISKWEQKLHGKGWNSLYLNNHDQPRMVSRFGNDSTYRVESAKMLATLLHTLEGTPYIYQGEEIGMTNAKFEYIGDYRDIETLDVYNRALKGGAASVKAIMSAIRAKGRDNARTPMQWSSERNAGFTCGEPWIKVNPNYFDINVKKAEEDTSSVLHYYRKLIRMRKENLTLVYGEYVPLLEEDEVIFSYIRRLEGDRLIVMLNFTGNASRFVLPEGIECQCPELLISNYRVSNGEDIRSFTLRPYEARVYRLH